MLKISAPSISSPINYICNESVISGTHLTHLKYSTVEPLFKSCAKKCD
jgi:hypothetical protein